MLEIQYWIKTGRKLNLKNPRRFSEKLQWYKLYYRDRRMTQCVDKYDVREYVISKGLGHILVPLYGVYDTENKIDWSSLPETFVMKDTLGGGGNSVAIVDSPEKNNRTTLSKLAKKWLENKKNYFKKSSGREWVYTEGKEHRVIFEKLLKDKEGKNILDYKFFCFDGKIEFCYVMGERELAKSVKVTIVDCDFSPLNVKRVGDMELDTLVKPANFDEMKRYAEILSKDFSHVRVDLYNVDGKIFFGELTFFSASGYLLFDPDNFDIEIGDKWKLPEKSKIK